MSMFRALEFPIPVSGEADSSFKDVKTYLCSYITNKASSSRLQHLETERERELLFFHQTQPIKKTSLLSYLEK
jgi:hypothetical protein